MHIVLPLFFFYYQWKNTAFLACFFCSLHFVMMMMMMSFENTINSVYLKTYFSCHLSEKCEQEQGQDWSDLPPENEGGVWKLLARHFLIVRSLEKPKEQNKIILGIKFLQELYSGHSIPYYL